MASIVNRSRYQVTVKNRDDLLKHFPYNKLAAVEAYMNALREMGYKPRADQLDESWTVRIREKGHKPIAETFGSQEAATGFVDKVTEERRRGLFIDYTASLRVSFADIVVRYLLEETKDTESGKIGAYLLEGWLEDSGPRGVELLARYREELRARGRPVRPAKFKMRHPSDEVDWVHKPFAEVTTVDIENYITERLEVVEPGTVDREIDRLKAIFKVAVKVWDYHLAKNPMDAVRKPKFFNERDRRISADEEQRLLAALAQLDTERAVEFKLRELAAQALAGQAFASASARKKALVEVRARLRLQAEDEAEVQPYLQGFYLFQVMTAARRGETLGLGWERIDFKAKTAFLPETKNGHPRKLSLRSDVVQVLSYLPQDTERVFAVGLDYIVGAWSKACEMAGIEDLRIHDCRHEAISRVAETGKFELVQLKEYSGHRDTRMLMRYAHLCASKLAAKLDECFADEQMVRVHRGRRFLNRHATVKLADLLNPPPAEESTSAAQAVDGETAHAALSLATAPDTSPAHASDSPSNVIAFRPRVRA